MKSIGASSRSPSPITMVPSIGTESISWRIASTAAWSEPCRSPWPMVCAQATAACSTTRRKSSDRSESRKVLCSSVWGDLTVRVVTVRYSTAGSSQRLGLSVR